MKKTNFKFDVMIIYDAISAYSAADLVYHESAPFAAQGHYFNCNACYEYFIKYCQQQNLSAAFTTTKDINAKGQFKSFWTYNKQWQRHSAMASAKVIFDKFSNLTPRNCRARLLLTSARIPVPIFHNQAMRILFDDKLKTYLRFPHYGIPTVKVSPLNKTGLLKAKNTLQTLCTQHPYHEDFQTDFVLKDQFGMGGNNIFKIAANEKSSTVPKKTAAHYVLQPFIQASGFTMAHCTRNSDLRIIICNNKIIQSYLRIAKTGEFRANAVQGGKVVYLKLNQIPLDVKNMAKKIQKKLPSKTALYALDFIKSKKGHLYFIEGNNRPGLIWFDREDEKRAKQLIHLVVKNLKKLIVKS